MPGMKNPMAGKGSFRHSQKIGTATKSATGRDVGDFDRGGYPGKRHTDADPVKVIAQYQRLGEALKKSHSFRKVAEQIAKIAEMAEMTVTEEGNDWFDQHTIKRNMKELKSYAGDFGKIAEDLDALHQRAGALYDDMGNVLARYFEVVEPEVEPGEKYLTEPDDEPFGGEKAPEFDGPGGNPTDDAGRKAWDMRDGEEDDEMEEQQHAPYTRTHGYDPRGPGGKKAKPKKESADDPLDTPELNKLWAKFEAAQERLNAAETESEYRKAEKAVDVAYKRAVAAGERVLKKKPKKESAVPMTAPHARQAMRTPAAMSRTHAGMSRQQAKAILKKEGIKTVREAKKAITKEHLKNIVTERGLGGSKLQKFLWKFWFESDPREIKNYVQSVDDDTLLKLNKWPKGHKTGKGSPQDLQRRLLDKEIKKRGLKESRRPFSQR